MRARTGSGPAGCGRAGRALGGLLTGLLVVAGGCATAPPSPGERLAWERWERCASPHALGLLVDRITPAGEITFSFEGLRERGAVLECLESASAAGPRLPEPRPLAIPRGP